MGAVWGDAVAELTPSLCLSGAQQAGALPFTHPASFHKTGRAEYFCGLFVANCNLNLAVAQHFWQGPLTGGS